MKIMKSIIAAILVLLLSGNTALAAAEVSEPQSDTSDITVKSSYEYASEWGYKYLIAVCQNNTSHDIEVSWDTISYDASGGILETGSSYSAYVAGGQLFTLYALFLNSANAADYQYKIRYEDASFIMPVYSDVTLEAENASNGKLIISATNNSNYDINTVQAAVLFFDDDENLVGFEDTYVVNSNYNVEAGETVVKDLNPPEEATKYEIYYTAYRY